MTSRASSEGRTTREATQELRREADVVIVGGGIIGCATAYYLALRGVDVVLLDRREIGAEQSATNWGFVRQQGRSLPEIPLMVEAVRMWKDLERQLEMDIGWVQGGNVALAGSRDRLRLFEQWLEIARPFDLDTKMLDGKGVAQLLPSMAVQWVGGLYTASDGHAEPATATEAFWRAAVRRGVRVYPHCPVEGVETHDGNVSGVVTARGAIRANRVVCAAGAWSARFVRPLALSLPRRLVRATVARTNPAPPLTPIAVWGPTLSCRQRPDGSFNLSAAGASDYDITLDLFRDVRLFWPNYWRNRKRFHFHVGRPLVRDLAALNPWARVRRSPFAYDASAEPRPNAAKVARSLAEFNRLFPATRGLTVEDAWAGYFDVTPDAFPVLGEVASPRGFIFATGLSGHGFAMGPIIGRLLTELIVDGKPSLDLRPFRYSRFAEGDLSRYAPALVP